MFPDPDKLTEMTPAEVLEAAAHGQIGLDHRFLHSLIDRQDAALPAAIAFGERDLSADVVDLTPELVALFEYWRAPEAVPFLVDLAAKEPEATPDEVIEALVAIGQPALEPLLTLYDSLEESESGEVAFVLASLPVRDERVLHRLLGRADFDLSDTLLLLSIYGDPAAIPAIEQAAANLPVGDTELRKEAAEALNALRQPSERKEHTAEPFDIWELYPEREDLPTGLLDGDQRLELLSHPSASVRAAAAQSFFNEELTPDERKRLLDSARNDADRAVRARSWEALINSTEEPEVVDTMLAALRNQELPPDERSGLLVGLASEADRNEVREAILAHYLHPELRAKALEAMWRSMHPAFRDYYARHMQDADLEVRRAAIWGVGYSGIRSELQHLRQLFSHEELRSDALFAYALTLPGEVSPGRIKGLLARVEKDAHGLSEMEEELVKVALDERLMLAGKEPVFREQDD